jgi:hypothetical protein
VLVTLTGPGGKAVTRAVNVRQLGYDKGFSATPATSYPAVGVTNQTFPVTSDSPWKFATGEADLTLEDETNWHPATATAYPYTFSLAANPGYAERDLAVTVTSSDEDFANRSFPIHQSGVAPYFTITSGSPTDFGAVGTPKAVGYKTNANQWEYTLAAGHENVIASTNVEAGVVQTTTATPTTSVSGSVTFTPSTSTAGWGGSTRSTTATFKTAVGIPGVNEDDPKVVTLSRTIPVAFNITANPTSGSEIEATATDVTVTANTNMKWWIQLESGTKSYTGDPTGYTTTGTRTVTIPARSTSEGTSWTTNGPTITVKAGYDAQTTVLANNPTSYTYTQKPYTLTYSYEPASPKTSVTITVTTNAGSVPIRLNVGNVSGTQVDITKTLTSGVGQSFDLGSVEANRIVLIVNHTSGTEVGRFTQYAPTRIKKIQFVTKGSSCPGSGQKTDPGGAYDIIRYYTSANTLAPEGDYFIQNSSDKWSYIYIRVPGVLYSSTPTFNGTEGEYELCYMGIVTD